MHLVGPKNEEELSNRRATETGNPTVGGPVPDAALSSSAFGPANDANEPTSEKWLDSQLDKAIHAARVKKAEEHLLKQVDNGNADAEFIENILENLNSWVAENVEMLDKMLAKGCEDGMDIDNDGRFKRGVKEIS